MTTNPPHNRPPVETRFKSILVEEFGIDPTLIKNEANFINDLGMDSLDLYSLVAIIDNQFNIETHDHESEKIQTVGEAISYIQVKLFNKDDWAFSDPDSPIWIEDVDIKWKKPTDRPWNVFNFDDLIRNPGDNFSISVGNNNTPPPDGDGCNDPLKPTYLSCEQWLLMNGNGFLNWLKKQSQFKVYKPESFLDSQALANGMTVSGYLVERVGLIVDSMNTEQVKSLGKSLRALGYVGTAFSGYKLYTAYSDGNITTRDVLAGVSFGLTVITLVPGVGTAIGLGGLALLGVGSMVFGIASDNVDDSVLVDFKTR